MERQQKIQQLLDRLDDLEAKNPQASVARLLKEEESKPRTPMGDSPTGAALKVLARGISNVQKDERPQKLAEQLTKAQEDNKASVEELHESFAEKIKELQQQVTEAESRGTALTKDETASILEQLAEAQETFLTELTKLTSKDTSLEEEIAHLTDELTSIYGLISGLEAATPSIEVHTSDLEEIRKTSVESQNTALKALEQSLNNRINSIQQHGGGNANRSILVGGDPKTLQYFTDINLKAGAGTTISYAANQTTKYTDITITATGSGSGITRSIQSVAINTAAAAAPSIDYVYLASGTITITLPTSVGNSNLYTIKNIGAGTVTIATTGGETIDGSANLILPLQFTSVDLISNNSGNWDLT